MDPIKESILVCALQFDGRGDVYGAHEIVLRVQKLMPHTKVVFTVLQPRLDYWGSRQLAKNTLVKLSDILEQENWVAEPEESILKAIDTFKRIIVFPAGQDHMLPPEILKRGEAVIKLREYGWPPVLDVIQGPCYTLGLAKAKGEKGVLLPMEKLPEYKEETSLERLKALQKVHQALSNAILGTESIQQFSQSSKLYLSYFSQKGAFFCYIKALLMCRVGNLVICNTQKRPEGLIDNIKRTLWKNGFGTVKIIEFSDSEKSNEQTLKFQGDKNKKICTILFRALSGLEMEAMLDATEEECLTTGDNSPLRFMAHHKIFSYDTREHKRAYAQSMIDLAASFDPRFKELLPFAFFGLLGPDLDDIVLDAMVTLFNAMKDPTLKKNWHRFIEEVFAKYDFTPELEKLLKTKG